MMTDSITDEIVEKAYQVYISKAGGAGYRDAFRAAVSAVYDDLLKAERDACAKIASLTALVGRAGEALENIKNEYVSIGDSGDAGFWNPREIPEVTAASAVLAEVKAHLATVSPTPIP